MTQPHTAELSQPVHLQWADGVQGIEFRNPAHAVDLGDAANPMTRPEMVITDEGGGKYYGAYGLVVDMGSVNAGAPRSATMTGTTHRSGNQTLSVGEYLPGFGAPIQSIVVRNPKPAAGATAVEGRNPFDAANDRITASHKDRYRL